MADLEYRIGGVYIYRDELRFNGSDPYNAGHKFVVAALDNVVSIYVAMERRHAFVLKYFEDSWDKKIVGGGSFYLNSKNQLVLDDFSQDYKAIPEKAAQIFAKLMLPKLEELGFEVKGIAVNPNKNINPYWIDQGFASQ